jgi:hypothetical protein
MKQQRESLKQFDSTLARNNSIFENDSHYNKDGSQYRAHSESQGKANDELQKNLDRIIG